MPLGVVSDKDFEKELVNSQKPQAPVKVDVINLPTAGRKEGDVNVPNSLRSLIGMTHATEGRQEALELAKEFGISPSSADAYGNGATSTASYNQPNAQLKSNVDAARLKVASRARSKMMKAMGEITDDKLKIASAKELSSVAKDMAAIIKTMEPEQKSSDDDKKAGPTFIFYAPKIVEEKHFDTITVNE